MQKYIKNTAALAAFIATVLFLLMALVPNVEAQSKKKIRRLTKRINVPNAQLAEKPDLNYYLNPGWEKYKQGNTQGVNGLVILNVDPQVKGGLWYYKDHPTEMPAGFTIEKLTTKDTGPEGVICGNMLSAHTNFYGYMCLDLAVSAKGGDIYVLKYNGQIVAVVNCGNAFNPYTPPPVDCVKCEQTDESTWTDYSDAEHPDTRDGDGYGVWWKKDNCGYFHRYEKVKHDVPGEPVTKKVCVGGYVFAEGATDMDGNVVRGFEKGQYNGKLGKRFDVKQALAESGLPEQILALVRTEMTLKKVSWFEVGVDICDQQKVRVRFFDKEGRNWIRDIILFGGGAALGWGLKTWTGGNNNPPTTTLNKNDPGTNPGGGTSTTPRIPPPLIKP